MSTKRSAVVSKNSSLAPAVESLELLTANEVCHLLKLSKKSLQRRRRAGTLPFIVLGQNCIRFKRSAIELLVMTGEVSQRTRKAA
jgi:predicted site-specific integrase-resolvase